MRQLPVQLWQMEDGRNNGCLQIVRIGVCATNLNYVNGWGIWV